MGQTEPDKEHLGKPAAVFEKSTPLKKWLFGIAVGALFVVSGLLIHSGGRTHVKEIHKHPKDMTVKRSVQKDSVNGHEWVDLGLPSGVLWATYNVGAESPVDFGDYYAWGETEPKEEYIDINSLTHRKDINWLMQHGIIGEDGNLTREHDVATHEWGEPWRMPTDEEYEELIDHCNWEFTDYNGTNGYLLTGPNGQKIFFVAAGFKQESKVDYIGDYGDYWSSTVVPELIGAACSLGYGPTSFGRRRYARFVGRTIRPVLD